MKKWTLLLAVLTCCQYASAMGGGHGTKPVNLNDSRLSDLANRSGRVGGYWVNSNDWFYFAGDTEALNDFLRQYAKLTETPHVLVVHPGKAPAERCVGGLFAEPYDWKLDSMWPAFTREKEWFEKSNGEQWQRAVIVQTWLGGSIRLDELKVPANVEVREGGEIKEIIERHNRLRTHSNAQRLDCRRNVVLRGAAASCRHLCLDVEDDTKVEQIGGATSARCLRLAEGRLPRVRWKIARTECGHLVQAQSGRFAGWYLDFDDDAKIEELGGATSSRTLLLTKEKVPGAYWKVTETDRGSVIQAQAGRFDGWYLDLDLLTKQEVEGAFWLIEIIPNHGAEDKASGEEEPALGKHIDVESFKGITLVAARNMDNVDRYRSLGMCKGFGNGQPIADFIARVGYVARHGNLIEKGDRFIIGSAEVVDSTDTFGNSGTKLILRSAVPKAGLAFYCYGFNSERKKFWAIDTKEFQAAVDGYFTVEGDHE